MAALSMFRPGNMQGKYQRRKDFLKIRSKMLDLPMLIWYYLNSCSTFSQYGYLSKPIQKGRITNICHHKIQVTSRRESTISSSSTCETKECRQPIAKLAAL